MKDLVQKAKEFATQAHEGQVRKYLLFGLEEWEYGSSRSQDVLLWQVMIGQFGLCLILAGWPQLT